MSKIPVHDGRGEYVFCINNAGTLIRQGGRVELQQAQRSFFGRSTFNAGGVLLWVHSEFRGLFGETITYFVVDGGDLIRRVQSKAGLPSFRLGEEWWEVVESIKDKVVADG